MREDVVTLGLYIWGAASMTVIVIWNIVRLHKTKDCRNKEGICEDMQCKWRHCCKRYDNRKEILLFRIEHLKMLIQNEEMN